jgi:hypothetical protein
MTARKARVRLVTVGWQATYACGCNSGAVKLRRDMPLACAQHGETVRTILHDVWVPPAGKGAKSWYGFRKGVTP